MYTRAEQKRPCLDLDNECGQTGWRPEKGGGGGGGRILPRSLSLSLSLFLLRPLPERSDADGGRTEMLEHIYIEREKEEERRGNFSVCCARKNSESLSLSGEKPKKHDAWKPRNFVKSELDA